MNSTDGDAGLQVFIDGEAWKEAAIFAPNGGKLVDFRTSGRVDAYGLTELFSESSEPPFEVFPISEFEELFPEGVYTFRGTTIERTPMVGRARVSHDFPDGPVLVALRKATWSPATTS